MVEGAARLVLYAVIAALVLMVFASLSGCNPISKAVQHCEEAAQHAWDECTYFYEDVVLPTLHLAVEALRQEIRDLAEACRETP